MPAKSKINREKFIKLWKNNVPYEVIANYFGVTAKTISSYKSINCREITRNVICQNCGNVFETKRDNKGNCDDCSFVSSMHFLSHEERMEIMKKGTQLQEKRRIKELLEIEKIERKKVIAKFKRKMR